jgi:uncharacterized membrane protein YqjE
MTDERYRIEHPEKSLGDLIGELTTEISQLVTSHVELAKAEIRQDAREAARAGGMLGGAGISGLVALLMLSAAAAWGLAEVIAPGWAFLVVGAFWAVGTAVLGLTGKKELDEMRPGPQHTMEEIKEDQQWLKIRNR